MFNWIFKKIASYVTVTTPEIDYAKLAEALNINNLANQIVISEEVIAEKIAEKFFGIPPPTSSASCFICNKLKYPHYGIAFCVQGDYPSGGGRVWRRGDLSCAERTLRDTQVVYIKRPLPLREGSL